MALHRILVVDDSAAVRETIGILLGGDYDVHATGVQAYVERGSPGTPPKLIIAAGAAPLRRGVRPFPVGVPLLWLEDRTAGLPYPGHALPRHFSPRMLRQRVAEILAQPDLALAAPSPRARLQFPYVPAGVAPLLAQALGAHLPLHLVGEAGVGKRATARALHAARGGSDWLALSGDGLDAGAVAAARARAATLFIDRVDQLDGAAQQALLAALENGGAAPLITAASTDLAAAAEEGRFAPDLYYRLTLLHVRLPPLRERTADLPALALAVTAELCATFGRPPVTLTEAALDRLAHYLWYGNLAELEAVLARSVALGRDAVLDAGDLLFDGARTAARPAPGKAHSNGHPPLGAQPLDLIINELAHEFKNPLVTIKTFVHHLRRSLHDGDEEQVARLTGEAVEQIDHTLENLLQYTRFDSPVPQVLPLTALVDPVLAECGPALGARGVRLEHAALPAVAVHGDAQQIVYALGNLIRSLARDLPSGSTLAIGYEAPATLTLQLPDGSEPFGNHLATLLDHPVDAAPALPLGVAIAHAVLERNAAHVALETPSLVRVRFTAVDDEEARFVTNGTVPRPGS